MADRSRSLIYSLHAAVTGKSYNQRADVRQGMYDPRTGTYYCGGDAVLNYQLNEDAKRYLASRYHDYKNARVDDTGKLLTKEQLMANSYKAEAVLSIMKRFGIPVSEFI